MKAAAAWRYLDTPEPLFYQRFYPPSFRLTPIPEMPSSRVEVIPNEGSGAAAMRIEAVRRIFPKRWFKDGTTEAA